MTLHSRIGVGEFSSKAVYFHSGNIISPSKDSVKDRRFLSQTIHLTLIDIEKTNKLAGNAASIHSRMARVTSLGKTRALFIFDQPEPGLLGADHCIERSSGKYTWIGFSPQRDGSPCDQINRFT
jgi:hypothetical protein